MGLNRIVDVYVHDARPAIRRSPFIRRSAASQTRCSGADGRPCPRQFASRGCILENPAYNTHHIPSLRRDVLFLPELSDSNFGIFGKEMKMADCSQFTLYSGAHRGAESEFGRQAERWGIQEVNFSFEGHAPERARGLRVLGPAELDKGDVSMEIVSTRMGRTYSKADKIRKVIQSIFHMINNGYQVFAVGWIQPDNTVKGGTGWGVELAKLFNRDVNVYDQDRRGWFSWKNNQWVAETPVISEKTFVGTGTRNLTEDGLKAVQDLFTRSFGPAKK
jgi:hypothetical protein